MQGRERFFFIFSCFFLKLPLADQVAARQGGRRAAGVYTPHGWAGIARIWEDLGEDLGGLWRGSGRVMARIWEGYGEDLGGLWRGSGRIWERIWEGYGEDLE